MAISTGTAMGSPAAMPAENDRLLQQAQAGSRSTQAAKIEKAGKDFESILLGNWLQGAEQSFAAAPGGPAEDEEDSGHDQFMGMAMQQLAGTLVASGGIGISRMIVQHLEAAAAASKEVPKSGSGKES